MDYGSRPYPNKLQTFRKGAGLQQKQVAALLGLNNPASLSYWENYNQMPSGVNLMKLCILYGKTIEEIYPDCYKRLALEFLKANSFDGSYSIK
jgi:transcriptional regulator with XRE-family HTH domain